MRLVRLSTFSGGASLLLRTTGMSGTSLPVMSSRSGFFRQPFFVSLVLLSGFFCFKHSLALCSKPLFQERLGKDPKTIKHLHGMGGSQLSLFPFTGIAD